jgi:hypothetical protein
MVASQSVPRSGFILKKDDLLALQTDAGGYTSATLSAIGVRRDVPWKVENQLIGRYVSWNQYRSALEGASITAIRQPVRKSSRVEPKDAQLMLF